MGKSFFEKLQKGMENEKISDTQGEPKPEEELSRQEVEKEPAIVSASIKLSSSQTEKKEKSPKKTAENKTAKRKQEKKIKVVKEKKGEEPEPDIETKEEKKWFEPEGQLTIDVYQTDGELVIQSAVAGVKPEDLDITIEKDLIIIKGVREKVIEKKAKNYFFQECYWGKFSREIISPVEIDGGRTKASIKGGVLTIRIPKIERKKTKRVAVIDDNNDD